MLRRTRIPLRMIRRVSDRVNRRLTATLASFIRIEGTRNRSARTKKQLTIPLAWLLWQTTTSFQNKLAAPVNYQKSVLTQFWLRHLTRTKSSNCRGNRAAPLINHRRDPGSHILRRQPKVIWNKMKWKIQTIFRVKKWMGRKSRRTNKGSK